MNARTVCAPDCPGRSPECHSHCPTYLAAWEENQRRYAEKQKEFAMSDVKSVGIKWRMDRMRKKQKQI